MFNGNKIVICRVVALVMALIGSLSLSAQDSTSGKPQIDPSKPTNLYTQVNVGVEYKSSNESNLYGLKANIQYAFNPDNLFLWDVPFYYNDGSAKSGVGDMRVRYYHALKRNISKAFIALVPFADITIPTGSFDKSIGSTSWSLSAGVIAGFLLSKKISLFPGISYIHITKPTTDLIPEISKFSSDGINLQFNATYRFNKSIFMLVNPTPLFLNTQGNWKAFWSGDLNVNKIITPNKLKLNIGWSPNFTTNTNAFRAGATLYL